MHDEIGCSAVDCEVAAAVADFGSDTVLGGQGAGGISISVIDNQHTLPRPSFEPNQSGAVTVECDTVDTPSGCHCGRRQWTRPTSVLSCCFAHEPILTGRPVRGKHVPIREAWWTHSVYKLREW